MCVHVVIYSVYNGNQSELTWLKGAWLQPVDFHQIIGSALFFIEFSSTVMEGAAIPEFTSLALNVTSSGFWYLSLSHSLNPNLMGHMGTALVWNKVGSEKDVSSTNSITTQTNQSSGNPIYCEVTQCLCWTEGAAWGRARGGNTSEESRREQRHRSLARSVSWTRIERPAWPSPMINKIRRRRIYLFIWRSFDNYTADKQLMRWRERTVSEERGSSFWIMNEVFAV